MHRKPIVALALLFTLSALALSGCSFFGLFGKDEPDFRSKLKLKIAVFPFENRAGIQAENIELNTAHLVAQELAKSSNIVVMPWSQVEAYIQAKGIPMPISQNTAPLIGRSLGLNAIVTGTISEVSQMQKREPWKKYIHFIFKRKSYVNSVLIARVIDVDTGVILGSDVAKGEVKTGQSEEDVWLSSAGGGVSQQTISESMDEAIAALADEVKESLSLTPWKGFIGEVNGDRAIISSGSDIGMKIGDQFVVFSTDETVTNLAGQTFSIPGPVKARLEVIHVMPSTSELKIVSGEAAPGETIQYSRK